MQRAHDLARASYSGEILITKQVYEEVPPKLHFPTLQSTCSAIGPCKGPCACSPVPPTHLKQHARVPCRFIPERGPPSVLNASLAMPSPQSSNQQQIPALPPIRFKRGD